MVLMAHGTDGNLGGGKGKCGVSGCAEFNTEFKTNPFCHSRESNTYKMRTHSFYSKADVQQIGV